MTTQPTPPAAGTVEETTQKEPSALKKAIKGDPDDRSGAGWFVKGMLLFISALWLLPTVGLLVSSFRSQAAVNESGWWTSFFNPSEFTVQNYGEVLQQSVGGSTLAEAFINSIVVALPATIIPITAAAFAAYAFSWMDFRGRETLFIVFVVLLVVPLQVAFIPIVNLYSTLGLQGGFLGLWLAHAGFGMPLAVYLLRNYIGSLPREVIESARVDGASHFTTFVRLILPLSVPALAAFAIFQFLWTWNDYLVALILLDTARLGQVSTTYLAGMIGTFGARQHLLSAGAFITILVPLAVFFSLQRFFVRGLTAGSVKG
ncbi:MAG: carbohydrate ABC transporter permease [Nitriliruptoraceae bacterium]